jgi:hypothetical protein
LLVVQAGLVLWNLRAHWSDLSGWFRANFRAWQLVGLGLILVLTCATVSEEVWKYPPELALASLVQLVNLGTVLLLAWALPSESLSWFSEKVDCLLGRPGAEPGSRPSLDRFAFVTALWVVACAAVLAIFSYQRFPHIPDEVAYLNHARFFAEGTLTQPAPPVREAFDVYLMQFQGDRWFPAPPPGWPVALALGVLAGVPWLVNPVLAGLNILLAYLLLQDIYDRRTARIALLLLAVSPWNLFLAMSFMTHAFTLFCTLGGAVAIAWTRRTGSIRWALLAGAAIGTATLIRPLDGLIAAALIGLWALGLGAPGRLKITGIAAFGAGTMLVAAAVLPYNASLTGRATEFPIMAYDDERFGVNSNAYGFGPDRGMGWALDPLPGHGPIDALINANLNMFSLNIELFGWSTGSLLLVALIILCGRLKRGDYIMLAVCLTVFWAYFFYYFSGGPDFGARYWFVVIVPGVALASRSIQWLEERVAASASPLVATRVTVTVAALCLMTIINYLPWRAVDKYFHYLGMQPDIGRLAQDHGFGRSLVLVRGDAHPDYAAASAFNPLDLQDAVPIYAWDRSPEARAAAIAAYRDRPIWLVDGPTVTNAGFRLVAGPLSANHELLAGQASR